MNTQILPVTEESLARAAELIRGGSVVAFGTETVYGLGANAFDPSAVRAVFAAKGRPADNPLIVHLPDAAQIPTVAEIDADLLARLGAVLPAPLTVILPKRACIPSEVTAGLDTVGVRVPASDGARAFLRAVGVPVAAPSANTSTRPSPTTARHVFDDLGGRIPLILDMGPCAVGVESTVVRVTPDGAVVYRLGGFTPERLERIFGKVVLPQPSPKTPPLAPGMKYRHYAPSIPVRLVEAGDLAGARALFAADKAAGLHPVVLATDDVCARLTDCETVSLGADAEAAAHALFGVLRDAERRFGSIVTFTLDGGGLAPAVNNRLRKASAGR